MFKRIATALVLIPIVLFLVLRAPVPVLAVVAGAVALATLSEFLKLTEAYGVRPLRWPALIFAGAFFAALAFLAAGNGVLLSAGRLLLLFAFTSALAPFLFLSLAMRRSQLAESYPAAAAASFGFVYIALPMAMLVQLRQQNSGAFWILYLLLVVWSGDIFAYFAGKAFGRHLMSPRISPKKTWEGAAASLLCSTLIGVELFRHAEAISSRLLQAGFIERQGGMYGLERPELLPILILTIAVNIAAQLGDLVESLIKRGAGVKDSGTLLPGHGGMLDRIDALLFAAPVLWVYVAWMFLA